MMVPRQDEAAWTSLSHIFEAESIAILGASADRSKIGNRPIRYLQESGYRGLIAPVNPKRTEIEGLRCFSALEDVGAVDLALVCLPSYAVLGAVSECVSADVPAAIIFADGFAESGEAGRQLQSEVAAKASEGRMRLLGPNCLGAINTHNSLMATFAGVFRDVGYPQKGRLGIVSQSGAMGTHFLAMANGRAIGISKYISTGNEVDIELGECLLYLAEDPDTFVVAAYLEGVRNGPLFLDALRRCAEAGKQLVVLKTGRTEAGTRAVRSHTDALAGEDAVYDSILRSHGALRAESPDDLFNLVAAFAKLGPKRLKSLAGESRIGILSPSGGGGILLTDAAISAGLEVPPLSDDVSMRLHQRWPSVSFSNPLDVTARGAADPSMMGSSLAEMVGSGDFGAVVIYLTYIGLNEGALRRRIEPLLPTFRANPEMLFVVCALTSSTTKRILEDEGLLVYSDPVDTMRVVKAVLSGNDRHSGVPRMAASCSINVGAAFEGELTEAVALKMLEGAGVPVMPFRVVDNEEDAVSAAEHLGFPVVMKVVSADIPHKSDVGGVVLNVEDAEHVRKAYRSIRQVVRESQPSADSLGTLIASQLDGGVEFIIGSRLDPTFGPLILCGIGGRLSEVIDDTSLRVAPVDVDTAKSMLSELKAAPILHGVRGGPALDVDDLARAVSRISQLAAFLQPQGLSIEVNPYLVQAQGEGGAALDALVS